MRRVAVYLSDEEYEALRREAERRGLRVSSLVRLAAARLAAEGAPGAGDQGLRREVERIRRELEELARRVERLERAGAAARVEAAEQRPRPAATDSSLPSFLRDNPWLEVLAEKR